MFWFGAHKVLKQTELKQLRASEMEVFNPAYISPVYDQSMDRRVDTDQLTTLPPAVFRRLLSHDFFYTAIPPEISELLNEYFDAVIVTINPDWLISVLRGFAGQVLWRIYGQPYSLSDHILAAGHWSDLINRERFAIVPFADESVEREHRWFLDLCTDSVPYQIPDDVFRFSNTWSMHERRREIAVSIPNIENPYYAAAYAKFDARYPGRIFKIYGPQRATPVDSRIVGALDRDELLDRFAGAAGYLYDYTDDVCYLPPIEAMEIGVPVLFAQGSLLSRFYIAGSPGMIRDTQDAEAKLRRLLNGDKAFVAEIIQSQDGVRARYDRTIVQPQVSRTFQHLLENPTSTTPSLRYAFPLLSVQLPQHAGTERKTVCIFLHVDGLFAHNRGRVYAFEGIPRVVDIVVSALVQFSDYKITVTCTEISMPVMHDFFRDHIHAGRVELHGVRCSGRDGPQGNIDKLWLIEEINQRTEVVAVFVPHYYLFPETLALSVPTILYLPDYFPYMMPGTVFDTSAEKDAENKMVGIAIAERSSAILTNSVFTQRYLPSAGFVDPYTADKVIVAPLPLLGEGRVNALSDADASLLLTRIAGRRFLFYPTANRPNKRFSFLLTLFAFMRLSHPDLVLILTGDLTSVEGVEQTAAKYDLADHIILLHRIDEGSLRWLYEKAAALVLTSTIEGNFPPQVLEALAYGTPVVTTRLPTIVEALGAHADDLLLCRPLDLRDFSKNVERALMAPNEVVASQARALEYLRGRSTQRNFFNGLEAAIGRCIHHHVPH